MPTFDYRFTVDAPVEAVLRFHCDPRILRKLTPPPIFVQIHRFGEMREGMIAEFTMWAGPIPIRWVAEHRNVGANGFTDVQKKGPAARWEHTHRFSSLGDHATAVHEHIEYEHKPGLAGLASRLLFPKAGLRMLFAYRRLVTRRALAGKES